MNQSNNSPNKNNLLDPPRINILNTSVTSEHENMEASYMDLSGSKANSTAKVINNIPPNNNNNQYTTYSNIKRQYFKIFYYLER